MTEKTIRWDSRRTPEFEAKLLGELKIYEDDAFILKFERIPVIDEHADWKGDLKPGYTKEKIPVDAEHVHQMLNLVYADKSSRCGKKYSITAVDTWDRAIGKVFHGFNDERINALDTIAHVAREFCTRTNHKEVTFAKTCHGCGKETKTLFPIKTSIGESNYCLACVLKFAQVGYGVQNVIDTGEFINVKFVLDDAEKVGVRPEFEKMFSLVTDLIDKMRGNYGYDAREIVEHLKKQLDGETK